MRKVFSLGLLALSMGFIANPALAGNVEDCEDLKGNANKALYGLCIAWHNAGNDNARDRILDNYNAKAGPDDPPMPGTEDEVFCPCWSDTELLDAACNRVLTESAPGLAVYDGGLVQFFNFGTECVYSNFNTGVIAFAPTDVDQSLACEAGLQALVNDDLLEFCP
mgnify:CR=1 FL=1|jgi:hypothetical protein